MNFQAERERIGVPFHPTIRVLPSISSEQELSQAKFFVAKLARYKDDVLSSFCTILNRVKKAPPYIILHMSNSPFLSISRHDVLYCPTKVHGFCNHSVGSSGSIKSTIQSKNAPK